MTLRAAAKWLVALSQILVGLVLLAWLTQLTGLDLARLGARLTAVSPIHLTLGAVCFVAAMGLGAWRYKLFLSPSIPLSYLVGTTLLQNSLLVFVPWRVGEISYPLLLKRDYAVSIKDSGIVLLTIRVTDLLLISSVAIAGGGRLGLDSRMLAFLFATGLIGAVALVVATRTGNQSIARLMPLPWVLQPLMDPARASLFILLSIAIFVITTTQSALILHALAFQIDWFDVAVFNALGLVAGLVPIHPPGGWGTMDSFQLLVLQQLGYPANEAAPAIIAAHSIYTLLIALGGVCGWMLRTNHQNLGKSRVQA